MAHFHSTPPIPPYEDRPPHPVGDPAPGPPAPPPEHPTPEPADVPSEPKPSPHPRLGEGRSEARRASARRAASLAPRVARDAHPR